MKIILAACAVVLALSIPALGRHSHHHHHYRDNGVGAAIDGAATVINNPECYGWRHHRRVFICDAY